MKTPLLFFADFQISTSDLDLFQENYAMQMSKKMKVPGFLFGYHYITENPSRTICLYGIESEKYLPSLFSNKIRERHPLLQEQSLTAQLFDFTDVHMGVYQLKSVFPSKPEVWFSDLENLHFESWEWSQTEEKEMLGYHFDQNYLNEILNLPSQKRAYRFEKFAHPSVEYLHTSSSNLAVIEWSDQLIKSPKTLYQLKENKVPLLKSRSLVNVKPFAKFWSFVR